MFFVHPIALFTFTFILLNVHNKFQNVSGYLYWDLSSIHFLQTPPNKKTKLDNDNKDQLTPEQQQRIDANCLVAKIKRTNKITPALHGNIGPSWFQALENEFSKPYFVKVELYITL